MYHTKINLLVYHPKPRDVKSSRPVWSRGQIFRPRPHRSWPRGLVNEQRNVKNNIKKRNVLLKLCITSWLIKLLSGNLYTFISGCLLESHTATTHQETSHFTLWTVHDIHHSVNSIQRDNSGTSSDIVCQHPRLNTTPAAGYFQHGTVQQHQRTVRAGAVCASKLSSCGTGVFPEWLDYETKPGSDVGW